MPATNTSDSTADDAAEAPEIGVGFTYDGRGFAVRGWLKRADPDQTNVHTRDVGPDHCPLVFSLREDAEYVIGTGVSGVLVRVTDLHVTDDRPVWQDATVQAAHAMAVALAGQPVR